mmetsp:Transcript_81747/g.149363  ORF Transcript_81747/g.149363 Transcript_81747/m.149363 type:complete len:243 (+) Transcript_81747:36-764(+)
MGEPMPRQNEAPVEKSLSSGLASSAHLHAPPCSMLRHCQTATGYRSHPCLEPGLHAHARSSHLPHIPHLCHLRPPRLPHLHPRLPHPRPRPGHDHLLRPHPPHAHHLHARSLHARAPLLLVQAKQDGHRHPPARALPLHDHPLHAHHRRAHPPHDLLLHARSLHARAPLLLVQAKQDGHRHPPARALPLHDHPLHAHHRRAHPLHDRLLHARPLHARHLCLHHLQAREAHVPLQAKPNGHRH